MSGQWNVCNDADINECDTNNGGCSADASCTNNMGSFTCTCLPGYTGDGFTCTGNINIYLRHGNSKRHKKLLELFMGGYVSIYMHIHRYTSAFPSPGNR